ncbi:MAG: methyltransferase domain-containing protein [Candidatus Korobacteraceae bacterium]
MPTEVMTTPAPRRGFLRSLVYPVLRPVYRPARYYYSLWRARTAGLNVSPPRSISMDCSHAEMARRMQEAVSPRVHWKHVALDSDPLRQNLQLYFQRHRDVYNIDKGRAKALEHALGLELFDFTRVHRYCDVASCASPIQETFAAHFPQTEFWAQDLIYEDDLQHFKIGGFAQKMSAIPDGFFDALTLHNSFEHFMGSSDTEFVAEVDRVLSPAGACLILPLYVAATHRIYFDPIAVTPNLLRTYDQGAELIPVRGFATQEHARCYDAATLQERLISRVPPTLEATILDFSGGENIAPEMFPEFALVLHRTESIFGAEDAPGKIC